MRIAVVGGGGREHALLATLARSPDVERLYAVPGNAGTAQVADNVTGVGPADAAGLADFAERAGVDLTIIGPEQPLVAGVADEFLDRGLAVFGPTAAAARIEGSKAFAKEVMAAAGVPTARAEVFADAAAAVAALDDFGPPWSAGSTARRARASCWRSTWRARRPACWRSPTAARWCRWHPPATTSGSATATGAPTPAAWAPTPRCRTSTTTRSTSCAAPSWSRPSPSCRGAAPATRGCSTPA